MEKLVVEPKAFAWLSELAEVLGERDLARNYGRSLWFEELGLELEVQQVGGVNG